MPNKHRTDEELAVNTIVGQNLKYLRKLNNLNQTKVGNSLGVSFQQIQKYEKGTNGLSALRLKQLAEKFKVSLDVLIDPNMITTRKIEIANELNRQARRDEFIKENTGGSLSFDASKYEDFEDEYPAPLSQLEHDPKMRATYDAILEDKK